MLAPIALYALLTSCAPNVEYPTMASIAQVESGRNPYAVGDNTTGQSYSPRSYGEAVALATSLIREGHNVDMGVVQVNSQHLATYGLTVAQLMAPCENAHIGGLILGDAYARAAQVFGPGRLALAHAISAYNTGSLYAGGAYVRKVIDAAIELGFLRNQPPVPKAVASSATRPVRRAPAVARPSRLVLAKESGISIPLPRIHEAPVLYERATVGDRQ
jgi:type IV secretion system protein VirB1